MGRTLILSSWCETLSLSPPGYDLPEAEQERETVSRTAVLCTVVTIKPDFSFGTGHLR